MLVVTSERSSSYAEATEALLTELERGGLSRGDVAVVTASELTGQAGAGARLAIALGSVAAQALADGDGKAAQIYALLPRSAAERLLGARRPGRQATAVYLDQPYPRQVELLRLALPEKRNLAVLWGAASKAQAPALASAALDRGLRLIGVQVERPEALYATLQQVLSEADMLLAVAEPTIYNSNSIQNILLASFRARVPLIAFSPAYVKAGALLALYSTPAQIGAQTGGLARAAIAGRPLPPPQYPSHFFLQVNQHVAHSLGLSLDEAALLNKLREAEHAP